MDLKNNLVPVLFNLYAERIMRKAQMEDKRRSENSRNNLRYADDTILIAGKKQIGRN